LLSPEFGACLRPSTPEGVVKKTVEHRQKIRATLSRRQERIEKSMKLLSELERTGIVVLPLSEVGG